MADEYTKLITERFHSGKSIQSSQLAVLTPSGSDKLTSKDDNKILDALIDSDKPIIDDKLT